MAEALLLLSGKVSTNEPVATDGTASPFSINPDGRLRVAAKPAQFTNVVQNLVLLNDALVVNVLDASNIVLHVKNTGGTTSAAGTFVFEGSLDSTNGTDGTWFGIQGCRSNANTIETTTGTLALTAGAGATYSWEFSVNAVKWFRVRCSVAATAGSIFTWTALPGSYATEPIPAIASHPVTGTVTVNPGTTVNYGLISAATTNASVVKASAGSVYELAAFNPTAAVVYLKLYNKATAPTVGTDVPILTIPVPVNGLVNLEFGLSGKKFSAGISLAITAGPLATDTAVVAAGAQISATYV